LYRRKQILRLYLSASNENHLDCVRADGLRKDGNGH